MITKGEIIESVAALEPLAKNIGIDAIELKKQIDIISQDIVKDYDGNAFDIINKMSQRVDFIEDRAKHIVETIPNIVDRLKELP